MKLFKRIVSTGLATLMVLSSLTITPTYVKANGVDGGAESTETSGSTVGFMLN